MRHTPSPPLISVIIATRNRRALLEEAIESVLRQTYRNWELIVVDDCSEDDSWAYVSSFDDHRIRSVRLARHSERSATRNRGLAEAKGEYILFLDDDDLLVPNGLRLMLRALDAERAAGRLTGRTFRRPEEARQVIGAVGKIVRFDGAGRRRKAPHPRRTVVRGVWREVLWGWGGLQGQALLRTTVVRQVGGWRDDLVAAEDQEFWLRLAALGPVLFLPSVVLEYRLHDEHWEPADLEEVRDEMRRSYLGNLEDSRRQAAERILSARSAFLQAIQAYKSSDCFAAINSLARAFLLAPDFWISPVVGRSLWSILARSALGLVIGRGGLEAVRGGTRRIRRVFGRELQGRVRRDGSALHR